MRSSAHQQTSVSLRKSVIRLIVALLLVLTSARDIPTASSEELSAPYRWLLGNYKGFVDEEYARQNPRWFADPDAMKYAATKDEGPVSLEFNADGSIHGTVGYPLFGFTLDLPLTGKVIRPGEFRAIVDEYPNKEEDPYRGHPLMIVTGRFDESASGETSGEGEVRMRGPAVVDTETGRPVTPEPIWWVSRWSSAPKYQLTIEYSPEDGRPPIHLRPGQSFRIALRDQGETPLAFRVYVLDSKGNPVSGVTYDLHLTGLMAGFVRDADGESNPRRVEFVEGDIPLLVKWYFPPRTDEEFDTALENFAPVEGDISIDVRVRFRPSDRPPA